jgi:transcriptional regulator with XRE-family HTH domain
MNRFEQRLQKRMQNEEFATGYWEMDAELELMHAIDKIRRQQHITHERLATLMGKKREAITRLLASEAPNPTLNTFIELLSALKLTADITLRQSKEGEGPIKVVTELKQ